MSIIFPRRKTKSTDGNSHAIWWFATALLVVLLISGSGSTTQAGEAEPATPDPEMAAMIAAFEEAGAPGEHHAHLADAVGEWTVVAKIWMAPDAPPTVTPGTATVRPILGGRYFRMDYESTFLGKPFQGIGIDGYDKVVGQHFGTWIDGMSTGIFHHTGQCEDGGKRTVTEGEMLDAMTGQPSKMRSVVQMNDDGTMTFTSYNIAADGSETIGMEMTYTRVK
jgi:hypothetical protein